MQSAAWYYEVGSGIFTGIRQDKVRKDFGIPKGLNVSAVIGFGYPLRRLIGNRKNRLPLHELVYNEKYGA
jgi:nitroreductase